MSDPFGDSNPVEDDVPQEISDFAPPADNSGDFYEVEPTEAHTNGEYEEHTEQSFDQHTEESYQPMDFAPAPVDTHADFQAEIPPAPMEIPAQIPAVEEDNELTKFMREYEEKIALKAQEQEKVAIECKAKAEEDMATPAHQGVQDAVQPRVRAGHTGEDGGGPEEREPVGARGDAGGSRDEPQEEAGRSEQQQEGLEEAGPKPVAVPAKKTPEDEEDVSRMRQLFVQLKASPLEQTRADAVAAN
ncbi:U-box domain-containing protein 4 [Phytophthora nicotianae]|uniref:U-box domain-containing protein 4 n=1 Tax=Phytophthora nicotianae TaxID=4792 RepID=A0A0W8DE12_PHYNI|nr:U-box domain-containing protein 4 [Phytophthora nicotianae]